MEERQLGGRYQIIERVGKGGMAVVYKAMDLFLERYVAIKMIHESHCHDEGFIMRFIREAKATAKLSHPNVVSVYDVGREGSTYYMVMELIDGVPLSNQIKERGSFSDEEAINITIQICDGLANAHQNGIIHRDIKPHNIMAASDGRYKVADFGISRLINSKSTLSKDETVMGSVHYLSPEQARGLEVNFSSDIYSVGVVLYELVTGQTPYDGAEYISIAIQHINEPIPDPRNLNPQLSNELYHIIMKALQKESKDRYQSIEELKNALSEALIEIKQTKTFTPTEKGTFHIPLSFETKDGSTEKGNIPLRRDRIEDQHPSKKPIVLWGVSAVVLLIVVGGLIIWNPFSPSQNQSVSTANASGQSPSQAHFKIIVGTFSSKSSAKDLKTTLENNGIAKVEVHQTQKDDQTLYQVRVGNFPNVEDAELQRNEVKEIVKKFNITDTYIKQFINEDK
ncbi:serine/threonine protein kinase [Hazenella coriacea]|uniref:Serine/threonine-protein kinase PrkC n=1 Tax=Hazenella coriacea TaxID=1179467 RepID=A0A4R3LFZ8_9BACL|nr:serine/threonine protein kinase [Hazenella coriacea]